MIKKKSIDYIFGMITGASLMVAFWACTNTPLGASGSDVQQVEVVHPSIMGFHNSQENISRLNISNIRRM